MFDHSYSKVFTVAYLLWCDAPFLECSYGGLRALVKYRLISSSLLSACSKPSTVLIGSLWRVLLLGIGRNLRLGKTELSQVIHIHDQEVAVGIRTRPFLLQRSPIGFLLLLWYVTTKFSSLKQRELVIWQFWRPGVQNTLYWDKIQVSVVTFIPEALGKLCSSEVSSPWRLPAILGSWLLQSR